ncbi:MAG TPA: hypothetical protein VN426_10885 [Syntrophomonadaceae bacterium]|nr:hypothetical protein [Syntrophomonadaceae bacterium]
MIDINFIHKANPDGEMLLKSILLAFPSVTSREIPSLHDTFLSINIQGPASSVKRVVNSPTAQANCRDRETMRKILSLNGLSLRRPSRESIRYYDFLLFDLYTISVRQTVRAWGKKQVNYLRERNCFLAAETAKRAMYHMGLDYALVRVAPVGNKQYIVINIDPSPSHVRAKDLDRLMMRLKRLHEKDPEMIQETQVKMGADPEFMLFHSRSGRMIAASEFFPRHGRVGYDNLRNPIQRQHPIAEIRPHPSVSPLVLADNVKAALLSAARMAPYRNIKWVAGSQPSRGFAIGGHIHFSKVKLNFALLRTLDNFLAIPIFLIENPLSAVRRRRRYGTLGNFRTKSYGGFEYRTLGSWLVSPEITRGVLCLAKIVVSHYLEFSENYLVQPAAQRAFYHGNQEYFRPVFHEIWSKICSTAMYQEYAGELAPIHAMIQNGECWDEKLDLRQTWKMTGRFKRTYQPRTIL